MFRIFVILAAVLALTNGQIVNSCSRNPGALPLTTVVEGCSSAPCSAHSNRAVNIRMTFRAPRRLNDMATLATGYMNVGGMVIPMQVNLGSGANTCNNLTNARCPVNQGDLVNYTLRFTAAGIPMMHNMQFEFRIVDHGPMICVMIPMRVVS
ncbi:uncharacterized protein [Epargyreus clarus]|uniref:uncharacterized protein n=1 Tax=Epargyreus clarus TaxID=520877 RepID=UPI003C2CC964